MLKSNGFSLIISSKYLYISLCPSFRKLYRNLHSFRCKLPHPTTLFLPVFLALYRLSSAFFSRASELSPNFGKALA